MMECFQPRLFLIAHIFSCMKVKNIVGTGNIIVKMMKKVFIEEPQKIKMETSILYMFISTMPKKSYVSGIV